MTNQNNTMDFKSLKGLSQLAIIGLSLILLIRFLNVVFGIAQIISPGMALNFDEAGSLPLWALILGLVSLLNFPIFLFTGITFLVWLRRANGNLSSLHAGFVEFSPGWAVGWWFIPFFNLVRPFQVVREIWCESDPDIESIGDTNPIFTSSGFRGAPAFMTLWWAFWILSNIAANITNLLFDTSSVTSIAVSGYSSALAGMLAIIAGSLAIYLVRDITHRQDARFLTISKLQQPGIVPPPPTF